MNFFLKIIICFFNCTFFLNNSHAKQLIHRDIGLYKFNNEVFFLSDMIKLQRNVAIYRCTNKDSLFFTALGIDYKSFPLLPVLTFENHRKNIEFLNHLLTVVKFKQYLSTQNIALPLGREGVFLKKAYNLGCINQDFRSINDDLRSFIVGEIFFRARFQETSFWISENELAEEKLKRPHLDLQVLNLKLKKEKIKQAMDLFVNSVIRQWGHDVLSQ